MENYKQSNDTCPHCGQSWADLQFWVVTYSSDMHKQANFSETTVEHSLFFSTFPKIKL